jgi:Ion channel
MGSSRNSYCRADIGAGQESISGGVYMLRQYLVGAAASVCNIAIHALVMVTVIRVARIADELATRYRTFRLIAVMSAAVTVLMATHLAEVLVWSLVYVIFDVAPEGSDIVYFAFVNYATLGYGDVTPVVRWHLLGPMTAMNGVLLFGWSTAVIFEVLRMTLLVSDNGEKPGWSK